MTAYQDGFETICTVSDLLRSESDLAESRSRLKSNSLIPAPRKGSGSDSVTRTRRARTGRYPSSPSESRPLEPIALYVRNPRPSGTDSFHENDFDSPAGMSNAWSPPEFPSSLSTDFRLTASASPSRTLPDCRLA